MRTHIYGHFVPPFAYIFCNLPRSTFLSYLEHFETKIRSCIVHRVVHRFVLHRERKLEYKCREWSNVRLTKFFRIYPRKNRSALNVTGFITLTVPRLFVVGKSRFRVMFLFGCFMFMMPFCAFYWPP